MVSVDADTRSADETSPDGENRQGSLERPERLAKEHLTMVSISVKQQAVKCSLNQRISEIIAEREAERGIWTATLLEKLLGVHRNEQSIPPTAIQGACLQQYREVDGFLFTATSDGSTWMLQLVGHCPKCGDRMLSSLPILEIEHLADLIEKRWPGLCRKCEAKG